MLNHKVLFSVSLSNGETIHEESGNFKRIANAPSPWERLLSHVRENALTITSIALYHKDGRRWNLPSSGNAPKFHLFSKAEKPIDYHFFRQAGIDKNPNTGEQGEPDIYAVIEAMYDFGRVQLWVHNETGTAWVLVTK